MDYQSNMVNSDRTTVFIDKAKKQAKRLLKLSKQENNQLNIENLAQAQEILSQLNGYESWHAMMHSIQSANIKNDVQNSNSLFREKNSQQLTTCNYKSIDFPFIIQDNSLISIFNITPTYDLEVEIDPIKFEYHLYGLVQEIQMILKDFKHTNLKINFDKKPLFNDSYFYEKQIEIAHKCGIDPLIAKNLFILDYPLKSKFALHLSLIIVTPSEYKEEHFENIYTLLSHKVSGFLYSIEYNINSFINDFTLKYDQQTVHNNWLKNLLGKTSIRDQNIIELISKLSLQSDNWGGQLNISKKIFTIWHTQENSNLIKYICRNIYNNDFDYKKFTLADKIDNIGIPFIHSDYQQIQYFDYKNSNNILFTGDNQNRYLLANYVDYIKTLEHLHLYQNLPNSYYIGYGSQESLYYLFKSTLDKKWHDKIHYLQFDSSTHCLNMFDLPLGMKQLGQGYCEINSVLYYILYNIKYSSLHKEQLNKVTYKIIEELYHYREQNPRMYQHGLSDKVDSLLPQHLNKSSYYELSAYFAEKSQQHLSQICHNLAMPRLEDIKHILLNNSQYYNSSLDNLMTIEDICNNLEQFIKQNTYLNQPSNIYFENHALYFFDLSALETNNSSIVNLLTHLIFESHKKNYHYLNNTTKLSKVFASFYNPNEFREQPTFLSICHNDLLTEDNDILLLALRESKKFYLSINITTLEISDYFLDYLGTQFFTTTLSENYKTYFLNGGKIDKEKCNINFKENEFLLHGYSRTKGNYQNIYELLINHNLRNCLMGF